MASGGARARSGPSANPNSLRQADKDWIVLPAEGYTGEIPVFPLADAEPDELALWEVLWRKPQAFMWAKLGLEFEVAGYVRSFITAMGPKGNSGWMTAALRTSAEIGLSLPGMHSQGWKFSEDELEARRDVEQELTPTQQARLRAVNGS